MRIQTMKLADLVPAGYNPRVELKPGDDVFEQIRDSFTAFGNVQLLVWNEASGNVVGGNQRLAVMLNMGIEETEVCVVDLPPAKEKALNVALNRIAGTWDKERLAEVLLDIEVDMDVTITGFSSDEVAVLLDSGDIDFGSFFEETEPADAKPKTVTCPNCGAEIEL